MWISESNDYRDIAWLLTLEGWGFYFDICIIFIFLHGQTGGSGWKYVCGEQESILRPSIMNYEYFGKF